MTSRVCNADGKVGFLHGVASFDPQSTSVLIWTRLTPPEHADHEVTWRVFERKDMLKPVARWALPCRLGPGFLTGSHANCSGQGIAMSLCHI